MSRLNKKFVLSQLKRLKLIDTKTGLLIYLDEDFSMEDLREYLNEVLRTFGRPIKPLNKTNVEAYIDAIILENGSNVIHIRRMIDIISEGREIQTEVIEEEQPEVIEIEEEEQPIIYNIDFSKKPKKRDLANEEFLIEQLNKFDIVDNNDNIIDLNDYNLKQLHAIQNTIFKQYGITKNIRSKRKIVEIIDLIKNTDKQLITDTPMISDKTRLKMVSKKFKKQI
jgi:hypothetical protein